MKSLEELETERLEWSLKTFPEATYRSSMIKLKEEAEEVIKEMNEEYLNPDYDSKTIAEEYADCLMCIFDSAGRYGITVNELRDAFEKKLEKNKSRTWLKNKNNTYSHVK